VVSICPIRCISLLNALEVDPQRVFQIVFEENDETTEICSTVVFKYCCDAGLRATQLTALALDALSKLFGVTRTDFNATPAKKFVDLCRNGSVHLQLPDTKAEENHTTAKDGLLCFLLFCDFEKLGNIDDIEDAVDTVNLIHGKLKTGPTHPFGPFASLSSLPLTRKVAICATVEGI
jgi:hypothetical protein